MEINVLMTSAGRRVSLVRAFQRALNSVPGVHGNVVAVDANPLAAALHVSDVKHVVPRLESPDFIPQVARICEQEKISLVIPLIDYDYLPLLEGKDYIEATGATLVVSCEDAIRTCIDKIRTYQFFIQIGIPTATTLVPDDPDCQNRLEFPLVVKPRFGSGSKDVFVVENERELTFFLSYVKGPIVQEFLKGAEYTLDVLSDFEGRVLSVVPRERIEVRAGEVSKSKTVKDSQLMEYGARIAESLKLIGPSTIQGFKDSDGVRFAEINPRFGGGVPLSIEAGADYPGMLIRLAAGDRLEPVLGQFREGLIMTRYDEAIFFER